MRNKAAKFLQRVTSTVGEYRRAKRFWNRVPHNEKPGFKDAMRLAALQRAARPTLWVDEDTEIPVDAWENLAVDKDS